ncbi:hypothetical protein DRO32_03215 [Candidatus Bathyarchaeota archaeon]|nr:MAG: hypothetical protein DRO32_03215 [Candidatus Bathyarchaeota archaeon]
MPIMIYKLLVEAVKAYGRPVTTAELIGYVKERIPMCADHVPEHLPVLFRHGLVERRLDLKLRAYVWEPRRPYKSEVELAREYPELFLESMYYHAVSDEIAGRPIPLTPVIELLYHISGGEERRPRVSFVRRVLRRFKEEAPELYGKLVEKLLKEGEEGVDPELMEEVKKIVAELAEEEASERA